MNHRTFIHLAGISALVLISCSKENDDVPDPILSEGYPQVILFDDEGGGELEESDEFSVTITLADRYDPSGEALGGTVIPLEEDFLLDFQIEDIEGISSLSDYVLSCAGLYEIDDCTTSEDQGIDILESYDPQTGRGQVRFSAGVEEIEMIFELDPDQVDDEEINAENEKKSFAVALSPATSVEGISVLDLPFTYEVLDDEAIFGAWAGEVNEAAFDGFRTLFGLVNEDIAGLSTEEVEEIVWDFQYNELIIEVVLKATEEAEECGEIETENIVIEIEADYAELTTGAFIGEIELEGDVELEDGSEAGFVYAGEFAAFRGMMEITLAGEFDDEETDKTTLSLSK